MGAGVVLSGSASTSLILVILRRRWPGSAGQTAPPAEDNSDRQVTLPHHAAQRTPEEDQSTTAKSRLPAEEDTSLPRRLGDIPERGERQRTEAEIFERNRELTVLRSAVQAMTSSLDLRYVLNTAVREITQLLNVDGCTLYDWNKTDGVIKVVAEYGPQGWWDPNSPAELYLLADYPLTREVLEDQLVQQLTLSQANADPWERADMEANKLKTRLMLPLVSHSKVMGLVELNHSREERSFSYHEISLARLLANQAASAVENAQLFAQAQQEIVERRRAEAALAEERSLLAHRVEERTLELSRVNAQLAKASRLKDEFLASMSHELRTPLNTIIGSAEILQGEVFGELHGKQTKYVRNIDESGKHLLSLINDILDLSKIEAGRMELQFGPVAVESLCQASLRLVKELALKKQLQLQQQFSTTSKTLSGDERRLKQILVNLLSNAIKFTPQGGQVGLEVTEDSERQVINFTVWDTGIGIAQEDMVRLFRPFEQLDSSLSRQYAGTGLGLSLVAKMVELHGGGVLVQSEVGQGSRFTVTLPRGLSTGGSDEVATSIRVETSRAIPELRQRETPPLILLAEDNEKSIEIFSDYLYAQAYRLTIARHGNEVLALVAEERPNIILMDVHMPGMDGLETTRHLRAQATYADLPIVILTAMAMPGDREKCLQAGANSYLAKPVNLRQMVETIENFLLNQDEMRKW
jgi:signal transduction histidine kinase/ActR/RegA family two-component response regulator